MKTNLTKIAALGSAIVAATLIAGSAYGGGQMHRMPADYGRTYPAYEFKVVSVPSAGTPLTVQLMNKDAGQLVADAHVTMQHSVWLGIKATPQVQRVQLALTPDGRGDYTCTRGGLIAGEKIVLRAHVPGEPSGTWTTIALND